MMPRKTRHDDAHACTTLPTWIGTLLIEASARGITAVRRPPTANESEDRKEDQHLGDTAAADWARRAREQLSQYLSGERATFDLQLDLAGTPFQCAARTALVTIPYGHTITYQEQASRCGYPDAHRAVASANARNPIPLLLPCHRVIRGDGRPSGFIWGEDTRRELLELELRHRH